MSNLDDTQPNRRIIAGDSLQGPPKLLFWGVIGLFVLVVVGGFGGIVIFREVLRPSQQQRVLDQLPFMQTFLKPTPQGGILPTAAPVDDNSDPLDLLNMPIIGTTPTAEPDPIAEETTELIPTEIPSTHTPTLLPTATATLIPDTATPVNSAQNDTSDTILVDTGSGLPPTARMFGFRHEQQTWNNCGPANITMALSFYGWQEDQSYAGSILKPNREDKNVSPHELATFVNENTAVKAIVRMGGDTDLLKALVANNFPVIIETGAMFEAYDWIGHYRTLISYDDLNGIFYFYDSFLGIGPSGQGVTEIYENVDKDWQAFNRTFIVVYTPDSEALLQSILKDRFDETLAAEHAFEVAQEEARLNPQNEFAWFNMGTALTELGRYQEAATAFDQARRYDLPWRMLWYQFGPFEAYFQVGRYDDILSLVQINLNNAEELEEAYFWRGRVLEAQGKPEQAASAYRRALGYNSNFTAARDALNALS